MSLPERFLLAVSAAVASVGYGSVLSRALQIEPNVGDRGILGLLSFGVLGCLIHFFVPISFSVQLIVLAAGILAVIICEHRASRYSKATGATLVIVFVFVLAHLQSIVTYDTGLYHLQTMRWITERRIVPGLGGLHGRLAFNSVIFPIAALVDRSGTGWIANALVICFALTSFLIRLSLIRNAQGSALAFWALTWSVLVILVNHYISSFGWYGVLNGDIFNVALIIYWNCLALGFSSFPDVKTDVAMTMAATVLAVIVKISAAPLLLPAAGLAWIHRKQLPATSARRLTAVLCMVFGIWIARSFALSGCAVYPVSETCVTALPWAEPLREVHTEQLAIRSWARQTGNGNFSSVVSNGGWFRGWLQMARADISIRLLLVLTPLGLIAMFFQKLHRADLLVIACGLAGCLIFWLVSAPDPRFGEGYILAAAIFGASVTCAACAGRNRFVLYTPGLLIALMVIGSLRDFWRARSDDYFYTAPTIQAHEARTLNGTRVFVPDRGDQCWDHPLPCTPYLDPAEFR